MFVLFEKCAARGCLAGCGLRLAEGADLILVIAQLIRSLPAASLPLYTLDNARQDDHQHLFGNILDEEADILLPSGLSSLLYAFASHFWNGLPG
jgi:hypothetical protein